MQKTVILFCLLTSFLLTQAQINFSSKNWDGDTWTYSMSGQTLKLTAGEYASTATLYTEISSAVSQWKINLHSSYNLSSKNYIKIILASESASDFDSALYLIIGSEMKDITLYIGDEAIGYGESAFTDHSSFNLDIVVEQSNDADGFATFTVDVKCSNSNFTDNDNFDGMVNANFLPEQKYMAISCTYTSSVANNKISFNRFSTNADSEVDEPSSGEEEKEARATGIRGAVVVNEIMANPKGDLALPAEEYVELCNTTSEAIDLSGWTISTPSTVGKIADCVIEPNGYILLCGKTHTEDFNFIENIATCSPWCTLNNTSSLTLKNAGGITIDHVDYSQDMYGGTFKKQGSWSLERVDPLNLSNASSMWRPSSDKRGGTPGEDNSAYKEVIDTDPPLATLINATANGDSLIMTLSEPIDTAALPSVITIGRIATDCKFTLADSVRLNKFIVELDMPIEHYTTYLVRNITLFDLAGNLLDDTPVRTAIADEPIRNKFFINEIMSQATDGDADYIEVYSAAKYAIKLNELYWGKRADGIITELYPIASYSKLMFPGDYIAICKDSLKFADFYPDAEIECIVPNEHFSNLGAEGDIVLALSDGTVLDEVVYSDEMHSPLISDQHDVSLERIYTYDSEQWASSIGGTPTQENKAHREDEGEPFSNDSPMITVGTFSPDGDGIDDEMILQISSASGIIRATASVFDSHGRPLEVLCDNLEISSDTEIRWNGGVGTPGRYIILVETYNEQGKTKKWRFVATITLSKQ